MAIETCPGPRCGVPGPEPCLEHEKGWRKILGWRHRMDLVDVKLLARTEWEHRGRDRDPSYRHMGLKKGLHLERRYRGEMVFARHFSRAEYLPDPYAPNDPGWDFRLDCGTVDVKACQWDKTLRINAPRMAAGRLADFLVVARVQVPGPDRLEGFIESRAFKEKAEKTWNERWGFFEYRLSHQELRPILELELLNADELWGSRLLVSPAMMKWEETDGAQGNGGGGAGPIDGQERDGSRDSGVASPAVV